MDDDELLITKEFCGILSQKKIIIEPEIPLLN